MALFEPPDMRSYDGVILPGITIDSPCYLAETARIAIVSGGSISIGRHFGLADYAMVQTYGGDIKIGNNVSIQTGCMIYGHGGLIIGDMVSIATQTVVVPANHNFDRVDMPIKQQGVSGKGIIIGNDVWIGAGCKIMDGITIGDGCVIGAGSVVTRSVPENSVAAGVPAKVIRKRKKKVPWKSNKVLKGKIVKGETPLLFLVIATSFGEADWILPALFLFKQKNPEWEIVTLFGHKEVYQMFSMNKFIFKQFSRLSSINIVPGEIDNLFLDIISPGQVKIIMKDYNRDEFSPFKTYLSQKCSEALLVNYPHSNHIYSNKENEILQNCNFPDAFSKHDLFLLGSEHDIPFWSQHVDVNKIRVFGYPRYDSWWIKESIEDPEFLRSDEYRHAKKAKKVFFYISRGPHPNYLSQQDYEYLVRSMVEVIEEYKDSLLLVKAHPRQNIQELVNILKPYKKVPWIISGLHLMQLAHISDVIISGWSSGILDTLAVDKPAIEFWRFSGPDPTCRKASDGSDTTIYRELGLSAPAQTKEELRQIVSSALYYPRADIWKNHQKIFQNICKFTDQASENVADCLTEMVK